MTENGLLIEGRERRLLSGEVHYWRLDPTEWGKVLDAVASLGFDTISTYVSWARHERARGSYEFGGAFDVERFLNLAHDRGLLAVVRVGPNTASEQEDSGWPRRVLDDPRCQARRPGGHPYLLATATHHASMPSYGSRATLVEIAGWYDEVAARLRPLQHPDGPIVAIQVDNELGYHFQGHAYALDYHPDTIEQYRAFLADHYGGDFSTAEPPVDGTDVPDQWRIDWVRFREHHLRQTLATLSTMLRQRGLDRVPLVHNDYPRTTTPLDLGALERSGAVDVAGADIYAPKEGGRFVTDLARHLSGSSRLPYMAELGTGWLTFPWLLPMRTTPVDEEHCSLRAFFGGIRAANVYMLVERDRWYGSPISAHGEIREDKAVFWRRLHRMLDELDWTSLRRNVRVLLVENRDVSRRIAARAVLGDVVAPFAQMLPLDRRLFDSADEDDAAIEQWHRDAATALTAAGIDFDRASSSSLPELDRYTHVILPAADDADPAVLRALEAANVTVLTGPGIIDPAALPAPAFSRDHPAIDLSHLIGPDRELLCLASASPDRLDVTISFDGPVALEGRWRPETLKGDGSVVITVEPWATQVWEVQR